MNEFSFTFKEFLSAAFGVLLGLGLLATVLFGTAFLYRNYNVWAMEMKGKALLMEATQTRQIQVEQAKAELESAKFRAEAISVIGKAAQDYPEYRTQEYIGAFAEALKEGTIDQIIYIPTEASLPLVEATRLTK